MNMPFLRLSILALSLFVISTTSGSAQELILITENAPPNSYIENDKLTGRVVEIVQAVLKQIGMAGQTIELYPWPRGYKMLESQKNIALFATSRTPHRENLFKWAGPIADNEVNLYKLKSRADIQATALDDLKKYSVGGGRKDQKSQYLVSQGFELLRVDEDKQNIRKLFAGRVDVIPYAATRLKYDVKQLGFDPEQIDMIWTLNAISTQIYIAFSASTDDSVVAKFQAGFDAIKMQGIQQAILTKWK